MALDTALNIEDTNVPGFRLHPLKESERATANGDLTRRSTGRAFRRHIFVAVARAG